MVMRWLFVFVPLFQALFVLVSANSSNGSDVPLMTWTPYLGAFFEKKGQCPPNQKLCEDRLLCLQNQSWCDGIPDCRDESDEKNCNTRLFSDDTSNVNGDDEVSSDSVHCGGHNFLCDNGQCFPSSFHCDGEMDCDDFSDEHNCSALCAGEYRCENFGVCVTLAALCNGHVDCPLGDDEQGCRHQQRPSHCQRSTGQYGCLDGACVPTALVCDGVPHCADASDEGDHCNRSDACPQQQQLQQLAVVVPPLCPAGQTCRPTPDLGDTLCVCPEGSAPAGADGRQCHRSVGHCALSGWCEYDCQQPPAPSPLPPSAALATPTCVCPSGYQLHTDNRSCSVGDREPAALLIGVGHKVLLLRVGEQQLFTLAHSDHDQRMDAVALDLAGGRAYWSVDSRRTGVRVMRRGLQAADGASSHVQAEPFISSGLLGVGALAWEWVTRSLYIADPVRGCVFACTDDSVCTVVLSTANLHNATPQALAVYPQRAALFWSELLGSEGRIMRADLSGVGAAALHTAQQLHALALSVDPAGRRLYWSNAATHQLQSMPIDGADAAAAVRTVPELVTRAPFAVAILGGRLLWSDQGAEEIHWCDKYTGLRRAVLAKHAAAASYHLSVGHGSLQPPLLNPCLMAPCSHVCLLSAQSPHALFQCHCPQHMRLHTDQHTCVDIDTGSGGGGEALLLATPTLVTRLATDQLSRDGSWPLQLLPPPALLTAITIARLPAAPSPLLGRFTTANSSLSTHHQMALVYADSQRQRIVGCRVDGTGCAPIVSHHMGVVVAVLVDPAGANVYWADTQLGTISVAPVAPSAGATRQRRRRIVTALSHIVHMSVSWRDALLFVALGGTRPAIYTVACKGSRLTLLVGGRRGSFSSSGGGGGGALMTISSLAFDADSGYLYWTDVSGGVIGRINATAATAAISSLSSDAIGGGGGGAAAVVEHFKSSLVNPHSVAVLNGLVYWLDLRERQLHWTPSARPSDGHQRALTGCAFGDTGGAPTGDTQLLLLAAGGGSGQLQQLLPQASGCQRLACHHLCLPSMSGDGGACYCYDGYQLSTSDGRSCHATSCRSTDQFECGLSSSSSATAAASSSSAFASASRGQSRDLRGCIAGHWRCDGVVDCLPGAGEDELNCTQVAPLYTVSDNCSSLAGAAGASSLSLFACAAGRQCVAAASVCDGVPDCADASDEHPANCPLYRHPCHTTNNNNNSSSDGGRQEEPAALQFVCRHSGGCVDWQSRCDGYIDCADASDESHCARVETESENEAAAASSTCSASLGLFQCADSRLCLSADWFCDGRVDCSDASDEPLHCRPLNTTTTTHSLPPNSSTSTVSVSGRSRSGGGGGALCDAASLACSHDGGGGGGGAVITCVARQLWCDCVTDCPHGDDETDQLCSSSSSSSNNNNNNSTATGSDSQQLLQQPAADTHTQLCANNSINNSSSTSTISGQYRAAALCTDMEFRCAIAANDNGKQLNRVEVCVDAERVCDGRADCPDASDERHCAAPPAPADEEGGGTTSVRCPGSSRTILSDYVCDGDPDCWDGWDESQCANTATTTPVITLAINNSKSDNALSPAAAAAAAVGSSAINCSISQYDWPGELRACASGWQCVAVAQLCDGRADCGDASDEGGRCGDACTGRPCQHTCRATPTGPLCACRPGYRLVPATGACVDIDECRPPPPPHTVSPLHPDWRTAATAATAAAAAAAAAAVAAAPDVRWMSPCSQRCANTGGSFKCHCFAGYYPQPVATVASAAAAAAAGWGGTLSGVQQQQQQVECVAVRAGHLLLNSQHRLISRQLRGHQLQLVRQWRHLRVEHVTLDMHTGLLVVYDRVSAAVYAINATAAATAADRSPSPAAAPAPAAAAAAAASDQIRLLARSQHVTSLAYDYHTKNVYITEYRGAITGNMSDGSDSGGVSSGSVVRVCSQLAYCTAIYRRRDQLLRAVSAVPELNALFVCGRTVHRGGAGGGLVLLLWLDGSPRHTLVADYRKMADCAALVYDRSTGWLWWSDRHHSRLHALPVFTEGASVAATASRQQQQHQRPMMLLRQVPMSAMITVQDAALSRPASLAVFEHWLYVLDVGGDTTTSSSGSSTSGSFWWQRTHATTVRRCHTRWGSAPDGQRVSLSHAAAPLCETFYTTSGGGGAGGGREDVVTSLLVQHRLLQPLPPSAGAGASAALITDTRSALGVCRHQSTCRRLCIALPHHHHHHHAHHHPHPHHQQQQQFSCHCEHQQAQCEHVSADADAAGGVYAQAQITRRSSSSATTTSSSSRLALWLLACCCLVAGCSLAYWVVRQKQLPHGRRHHHQHDSTAHRLRATLSHRCRCVAQWWRRRRLWPRVAAAVARARGGAGGGAAGSCDDAKMFSRQFHNPVYGFTPPAAATAGATLTALSADATKPAGGGGEGKCTDALCRQSREAVGDGSADVRCPLHHTSAVSLSSSNTASQSSAYNSDMNDNVIENASVDVSHHDKLIN